MISNLELEAEQNLFAGLRSVLQGQGSVGDFSKNKRATRCHFPGLPSWKQTPVRTSAAHLFI